MFTFSFSTCSFSLFHVFDVGSNTARWLSTININTAMLPECGCGWGWGGEEVTSWSTAGSREGGEEGWSEIVEGGGDGPADNTNSHLNVNIPLQKSWPVTLTHLCPSWWTGWCLLRHCQSRHLWHCGKKVMIHPDSQSTEQLTAASKLM